jgi:ABC-type transport system involved in cytochrome c biogenesis permease component
MEFASENFNLHATLTAISQAVVAVVCHMLFMWALHGLGLAAIVAVIGLILFKRGHRFGAPLMHVARRTAIFCAVVCLPGVVWLAAFGKLPDAGVFNFNSLGLIGFWSLIYLHLSAEEINHRQFSK